MIPNSNNEEIEVKFHVPNLPSLRQRLEEIGADRHSRVFETNVRFDDDQESLLGGEKLLRLRKDKTCRLTFKSKPTKKSREFKIYKELEIEASDFDTTYAILNALGYKAVQIYEKWRETYSWSDAEICLDTMPFGDFLEIEGPEPSIRAAADRLGLEWSKRILRNYLSMFEQIRRNEKLLFSDVTFDNFREHAIDLSKYLSLFQADTD